MNAPQIDHRSDAVIAAQVEDLVRHYTAWHGARDGSVDGVRGMARLFARLAGITRDRLNRIPDKDFLAFLNLIGTEAQPPQAARVPLTFSLVEGSPIDAFVPAGTAVAASPDETHETESVFRLDDELVVVRSQLRGVYVDQPISDTYADRTALATGKVKNPWEVFTGNQAVPHELYLACNSLLGQPGEKQCRLEFTTAQLRDWDTLPFSVSFWTGNTWQVRAGIAEGLTIQFDPALPCLTLAPGRAITESGVSIAIQTPQTIDFRNCNGSNFQGKTVLLLLEAGRYEPIVIQDRADAKRPGQVCLGRFKVPPVGAVQYAPFLGASSGTAEQTYSIAMTALPAIAARAIDGQTGHWLRLAAHRPLVYGEAVPQLQRLTTTITLDQRNLKPDACRFNTIPLDISKDFYPFGERPQFNDTFYLACEAAFVHPDAQVTIAITPSRLPVKANGEIELAWEYWNGTQWQVLGRSSAASDRLDGLADFRDTTRALTVTSGVPTVSFRVPGDLAVSLWAGESRPWIRVRILRGNYGIAAYASGNTVIPDSFAPPSLAAMTITFNKTATRPIETLRRCNNFQFDDRTTQAAIGANTVPFSPFEPRRRSDSALYLGFDRPFPNRTISLYLNVEGVAPGRLAQRSTRLSQDCPAGTTVITVDNTAGLAIGQCLQFALGEAQQAEGTIVSIDGISGQIGLAAALPFAYRSLTRIDVRVTEPELIWEYLSASGWQHLGAIDSTNHLKERGTASFIGPIDWIETARYGRSLYWLRLRWGGGEFPVMPQLCQVLTNTGWASQTQTLDQEILGSGTGDPGQTLHTLQTPVLFDQILEVREELSEPELAEILAEYGNEGLTIEHDSIGELIGSWVRWQAVPDFYASGSTDRHYTLDRRSGCICFGDGQQGRSLPVGQRNVRLTYQAGGGQGGNRAAETVTQLKTTVPYIDRVTNLDEASGGSDWETLERTVERGPKQLRHRDRAVTIEDLEDLAFAASTEVARACVIPPQFDPDSLAWIPTLNLPLDATGTIVVQANWTEVSVSELTLLIYAPGAALPILCQNLRSGQTFEYAIGADELAYGSPWQLTLTNPSSGGVSGSLQVNYGDLEKTLEFSGLNASPIAPNAGAINAGRVDLIIVPQSSALRPSPSLGLLDRVENYLQARCPTSLLLYVTEPEWVKVEIELTAISQTVRGADALRSAIDRRVTTFLHPLTGGSDGRGWSFGRQPHESDLYALLAPLPNLDRIHSLTIRETPISTFRDADRRRRCLIYSGKHTITIRPHTAS